MGLRRRVCRLLPPLLLLLSALLVCIRSQDQKSAFAIVGEDFTFSPKVNGTIREITWMKGKNKVAEWEGAASSPLFFSDLKQRAVLDVSSGNLTIRDIKATDAADYEAQILAGRSGNLQYTKFVLEVWDPPSLVLNCSVTNDQINISCETRFSKNVIYSWSPVGMGKVVKADGSVIQFEKNADLPEQVMCIVKVSKTKINSSISLSACPQESFESLTRSRDGLVVFFVVVFLLLIMVALLCVLWKKGWLNNILHRIPTKQSAEYKVEEQYQDEASQENNGRKEDEATNEETKSFVAESHQSGNQSQDNKDEVTNVEKIYPVGAETFQIDNLSEDDKEPEYENTSFSDHAANVSDEATNEETIPLVAESHQSGNQSQDNTESHNKDENTGSKPDEAKNAESLQMDNLSQDDKDEATYVEIVQSDNLSQDNKGPAIGGLASEIENMAGTETGS